MPQTLRNIEYTLYVQVVYYLYSCTRTTIPFNFSVCCQEGRTPQCAYPFPPSLGNISIFPVALHEMAFDAPPGKERGLTIYNTGQDQLIGDGEPSGSAMSDHNKFIRATLYTASEARATLQVKAETKPRLSLLGGSMKQHTVFSADTLSAEQITEERDSQFGDGVAGQVATAVPTRDVFRKKAVDRSPFMIHPEVCPSVRRSVD